MSSKAIARPKGIELLNREAIELLNGEAIVRPKGIELLNGEAIELLNCRRQLNARRAMNS